MDEIIKQIESKLIGHVVECQEQYRIMYGTMVNSSEKHIKHISKLESTIRDLKQQLEQQQNEYRQLTHDCDTLKLQVGSLKEKEELITNKDHEIGLQTIRISSLENQVQCLEEDNKNLTKVSQIVLFEKENARLKAEVAQLTNRLKSTKISTLQNVKLEPQECIQPPTSVLPKFKIKTIKNVKYFVSDDENMYIYEMINDQEWGEKVGYLERNNDKLKAKWINV